MPPPQCPECGRFLATAFVQQIRTASAPCPRCGTELSLADDDGDAVEPEQAPPVPPPSATMPESAVDADPEADTGAPVPPDATSESAATEPPQGEQLDEPEEPGRPQESEASEGTAGGPEAPVTAATLPDEAEPEHTESVRPPDRAADRDPLEGWDEDRGTDTVPALAEDVDPAALAAGAGVGLVAGLVLGGRAHRVLGALLGAALGAVLARLRA